MMTWDETLDCYETAFGIRPGVGPDSERIGYLQSIWTYCTELLPKPCRIVELGCYMGKSALVAACAIHGTGSHIICVDPVFETGELIVPDLCHEGWVRYSSELRNVVNRWSKAGVSHMISVVPTTSEKAITTWDGQLIDALFVDGQHTYDAVQKDLRWTRWVKPGGIAVVDDWITEIRQACLDYFADKNYFADKPEWSLEFESTSPPPDVHPKWAISLFKRLA